MTKRRICEASLSVGESSARLMTQFFGLGSVTAKLGPAICGLGGGAGFLSRKGCVFRDLRAER